MELSAQKSSASITHASAGGNPPPSTCQGPRQGEGKNVTNSESFKVKLVAADAEVFDDVGDDALRHVPGMPCKGDKAVGAERVGIMAMTTRTSEYSSQPIWLRRRSSCRQFQDGYFPTIRRRARTCRERQAGWGGRFRAVLPGAPSQQVGNGGWLRHDLARVRDSLATTRLWLSKHHRHRGEVELWR